MENIKEEVIKNFVLFSEIDNMIEETLKIKSLEDMCVDFEKEVTENRGKYVDDFNLALAMGEQGERIVRRFLENLGYVFFSKCEDISHDYKFIKNGKESIFEIKTDVAHIRNNKNGELYDTGNMALEYESRGKKSGIAATKADFFITYYPHLNEIWLAKTESIKNLIRENADTIRKVTGGDSNSETKMFLLNREQFKGQFRIASPYNK